MPKREGWPLKLIVFIQSRPKVDLKLLLFRPFLAFLPTMDRQLLVFLLSFGVFGIFGIFGVCALLPLSMPFEASAASLILSQSNSIRPIISSTDSES